MPLFVRVEQLIVMTIELRRGGGSESPNVIIQNQRDSPKVSAWCGMMEDRVIGPFIVVEVTLTGDIYCVMLTDYVFLKWKILMSIKAMRFSNTMAPHLITLTVCVRACGS